MFARCWSPSSPAQVSPSTELTTAPMAWMPSSRTDQCKVHVEDGLRGIAMQVVLMNEITKREQADMRTAQGCANGLPGGSDPYPFITNCPMEAEDTSYVIGGPGNIARDVYELAAKSV